MSEQTEPFEKLIKETPGGHSGMTPAAKARFDAWVARKEATLAENIAVLDKRIAKIHEEAEEASQTYIAAVRDAQNALAAVDEQIAENAHKQAVNAASELALISEIAELEKQIQLRHERILVHRTKAAALHEEAKHMFETRAFRTTNVDVMKTAHADMVNPVKKRLAPLEKTRERLSRRLAEHRARYGRS